ncbi:MAG: gliding motility protein GldM [Bacteroidales bacterium]|nr:gliding motility protein GldM [Bacteroidales bacterium]
MAGYKETPRQKMIAMMYIVLTALLALNVSKSMLDAFLVVNESMETTNKNFQEKIDDTYNNFEKQFNLNQTKVKPFWDKAKLARQYSNNMINYIESLKLDIIIKADHLEKDTAKAKKIFDNIYLLKHKDDFDTPTHYFIGNSQDGSKGKARELKNKINEFKINMTNLVEDKYKDKLRLGLETEGEYQDVYGKKQNWEMHNFYHTIATADIAILNKFIAEVQNAELHVLNHLYQAVDAETFKFDEVNAKVIPKTNYCFLNDDYEAEILVAAYNTKQNPEVLILEGVDSITAQNIKLARPIHGDKGKVKLTLPSITEGKKKYAGIIKMQSPTGETNSYYFHDSYYVAKPSLTVSAKKMNVFYVGVDNPVSISVPGIAKEQIITNITGGGSLTKDPKSDDYIVRIPKSAKNKAVIKISAKFNGKIKPIGEAQFRVKRVPNPIAYIANKNDGLIDKEALLTAGAIIPQMPSDFDFELYYVITSFTFTTSRGGDIIEKRAKGNKLTSEMMSIIRSAKKGQRIWLENIIAKGPDGNRKLSSINLKIK